MIYVELCSYYHHHSGCNEAIVPTSSLLTATAIFDSSVTYLLSEGAKDFTRFTFNETDQLVNSSLCRISSLEVYRGRQQAIEISYQGFSLTDNGSIKVHTVCIICTYLLRAVSIYYFRLLQNLAN